MRRLALPALLILLVAPVAFLAWRGPLRGREPAQFGGGEGESEAAREERRVAFQRRLLTLYDLSGPRIDLEGLYAPGVEKDGIPALTDPDRAPVRTAEYPADGGRVIAVEIGGEAVAYPLGILNWHEIANDVVGGTPVAVTYCPLCDSVSVFARRLEVPDGRGGTEVVELEFGVSGLLYNSNVVMYERSTMGLWSQVLMQAVTGPHAGRELEHLPVRMMTIEQFRAEHPDGEVLTVATGHERPYDRNPYADYFTSDRLFMDMEFGDALPPKTLGLGVRAGDYVAFVTADAAMGEPIELPTPAGPIVISSDPVAGVRVESAPPGAQIVQTFYHSWSAFYPHSTVVE